MGEKTRAWSVKAKLFSLSLLSAGAAWGVLAVALSAMGTVDRALEDELRTSTALRNHLEADMMHDALRADVLQALYASAEKEGSSRAEIEASLRGHAEHFRDVLAKNEQLDLPRELSARIAEVRPALDAYVALAERMVSAAFSDRPRAVALWTEFSAAFEALEARNAAVSDDLEGRNAATSIAARASLERARTLVLAVAVIASAIGLFVSQRVGRRISTGVREIAERAAELRSRTFRGLRDGLQALSHGDTSRDIDADVSSALFAPDGDDELGALKETLNDTVLESRETLRSFYACRATIEALVHEAALLAEAGRSGRLGTRGAAERFEGRFRELVVGVNDTLSAVIEPIDEATRVLERVARRDFTTEIVARYHGDHAKLADALNTAIREVRRALGRIGEGTGSLAASSGELTEVSRHIGAEAEASAHRAAAVSAAADAVTASISHVSASAEELGAAIQEIARSAAEAADVAADAVRTASETNEAVGKLGASSAEVSEVLTLIRGIASQTNLLALNATIEAARAGAAGRGFAVVATEVKALAQATTRATHDVGDKVTAIQRDSERSMAAIQRISAIVSRISDLQTTIAGAVTQHTATTSEMGRSITEAARGVTEIAGSIIDVAARTQETEAGARQGLAAAQQLAALSSELGQLVGEFDLDGVRRSAEKSRARVGLTVAPYAA